MAFDLAMFSDKLRRYMEQFQTSYAELSERTGIDENRLREFDKQQTTPTGDEILILADVFMCD
jgi:transcriptional regulator with XRE-family HTH domain